MIRCEDRDLERFSLDEGDIAVPVEIYLPNGAAEAEITAYSAFLSEAETFARTPGAHALDAAALQKLADQLAPRMAQYGFLPSPDRENRIDEYILRDAAALRREVILPDTRICTGEENAPFESAVMHSPEEGERCAVHVVDGVIAACAVENDSFWEDGAVEISVECAPQYRGSGLASSCAALLAESILAEGSAVRYHCRVSNAASARVAEKVGFTRTGTRCSFVFYRKEFL